MQEVNVSHKPRCWYNSKKELLQVFFNNEVFDTFSNKGQMFWT